MHIIEGIGYGALRRPLFSIEGAFNSQTVSDLKPQAKKDSISLNYIKACQGDTKGTGIITATSDTDNNELSEISSQKRGGRS